MKLKSKSILLCLTIISGITTANAGVVVGGTRVLYDGAKNESSLSVSNPDSVPYLIQSWIDDLDNGSRKAPFIITPPLFRLDQGQKNVLRIVRAGGLADNTESMYWLNIKCIPSAEKKENTLQIAVKTRIKLIYRPESLSKNVPEDFADKLTWQKQGDNLSVINPSSYFMNFNEITVGGKKLANVTYVAPGKSTQFKLPAGINGSEVEFKIINDFGGTGKSHRSSLH